MLIDTPTWSWFANIFHTPKWRKLKSRINDTQPSPHFCEHVCGLYRLEHICTKLPRWLVNDSSIYTTLWYSVLNCGQVRCEINKYTAHFVFIKAKKLNSALNHVHVKTTGPGRISNTKVTKIGYIICERLLVALDIVYVKVMITLLF